MDRARIYILYGQFNVAGTMPSLLTRLAPYGQPTGHSWDDPAVIPDVKQQTGKIVLIGYSLGANQLPWIAGHVARSVDQIIGYDPSRQSPLCHQQGNEWVEPVPHNVKEAFCYYNGDQNGPHTWYYGGAKYTGSMVSIHNINESHFWVCSDENLHQMTIDAVKTLVAPAHV